MKKPFLILQLRPVDAAADGEFEAFLKHGGLLAHEVVRIRMENGLPNDIHPKDYSAIIVGGGPANVSDSEEKKPDYQKRFEAQLFRLLRQIVQEDIPYFGACYGLGALITAVGGEVSKEKYSESVGPVTIQIEDSSDMITKDLPNTFTAFAGHKEAVQQLPEGFTCLASTVDCPFHLVKIGDNVYASQFHPELDATGICLRTDVYKHAGYFPPEDAEKLKEQFRNVVVTTPMKMLQRFVEHYRAE